MKTILTLLGDYYHNHDNLLYSFDDSLRLVLKEYSRVDAGVEKFAVELGKRPDLIVIGKENRLNPQDKDINFWMTEEIENMLVEYVKEGGKLFVWHSGLAQYPENGPYCSMVRGYFKYHPEKNKPVRYYSKDNTLLNQTFDFEIIDEHYFVHCDTNNTNVFLYSESEDGQSIAGWAHKFGKGKVLALTPAHREDGLNNAHMKELLKRCLIWLLWDIEK